MSGVPCPLDSAPVVGNGVEVNAITLARAFGRGETFWLGDVSVLHSLSFDGRSVWIGVQFGRIRAGRLQANAIDGHITATYLLKAGTSMGSEVAAAMQKTLAAIKRNQGGGDFFLRGQAHVNEEYAVADDAFIDILVASPLHQTMFRVLHAGVSQLPRSAWMQKQAHPLYPS